MSPFASTDILVSYPYGSTLGAADSDGDAVGNFDGDEDGAIDVDGEKEGGLDGWRVGGEESVGPGLTVGTKDGAMERVGACVG
jgi:hypothetical protein